MTDDYNHLLDAAFEKLPELAQENVDFKIPVADVFVQGSKTIVRNFSQIADVARRSTASIAKYMTKELAVPVNVEKQSLIISSKVPTTLVAEKIKKYFETFIICKECHKPDTREEMHDRGFITIICEACGARYTIKNY